MQLIGLSGLARSGKDTVGDRMVSEHNFKRYAFADPLKRAGSEMFGIPLEDFHSDDKKEVVNDFWGFSPRQIAQLIGTEGGRMLFRDDIWVKRAEMEYLQHQNYVNNFSGGGWVDEPVGLNGLVITDVRFVNEAQWIQDMGGIVIHINRPGADGVVGEAAHASEAGYPDELKDYIVENAGSLDDLHILVDNLSETIGA